MKLVLLTILFISLQASAKTKVSTGLFGGIYLSAPSCDQLKVEVEALRNWTKLSDGKLCKMPKLRTGGPGFMSRRDSFAKGRNCKATITDCLPKHVQQYHDSNPETDGPNCWNLSLVMAGILPQLRYSTPQEMSFYMDPPLCRPLQLGEERRPGDVGAIRKYDKSEIHGFIYISEELSYSKNGYTQTSPYALQPLSEVYRTYGLKKAKKECLANRMAFECDSGVEFYRCISMEEYLKQVMSEEDEPERQTLEALDKLDCATGELAFDDGPLTNQTIETIQTLTDAINMKLKEQYEEKPLGDLDDHEQFMLGATKLRLEAIYQQLDTYQTSEVYQEDSDEMFSLKRLIRESQSELNQLVK